MSVIRKFAASRLLAFFFVLCFISGQASATTILTAMPNIFVNGTPADATQVNANFAQIVTQTNAGAAGSGANSDITSLNALATPLTQSQGGNVVYLGGTSTGSANAQATAVTTPTGWTLASGKRVVFLAGFTNTNAMTLAVNGTAATAVLKTSAAGLVALTGNEVIAGNTVEAAYDGTEFVLLNQNLTTSAQTWVQAQAFSKAVTLSKSIAEAKGAAVASATTTDIWTPADGNFIHITGTTTITSLGTAPQAGAERVVIFDGILTLTYNATSLILPGAANITTAANDRMIVRADTTANMIVVDYVKANGQSVSGGAAPVPHITVKTSGTTFTTNAATKWTKVTVVGGGGGGANGAASSTGGGGGGGGCAIKIYTTLAPSTAYTYAVGAAGAASTFTDGTTLITGSAGAGGTGGGAGGGGGTGTNGDSNFTGQSGGTGGASTTPPGGNGGNSALGFGGGGSGAFSGFFSATAGTIYGGGGGGGSSNGVQTTGAGGAAGVVIFEEWY